MSENLRALAIKVELIHKLLDKKIKVSNRELNKTFEQLNEVIQNRDIEIYIPNNRITNNQEFDVDKIHKGTINNATN